VSTSHSMLSTCASALLRVRGLAVSYDARSEQPVPALRQVDFDIAPGEIVGILGESGSGKSTLALSILGLLPQSARLGGSIFLDGEDLSNVAESRWAELRGVKVAMIFQEPGLSLSPVMRAGDQIGEVIRAHHSGGSKQRKLEVETALKDAGISDVDRIYRAYPHQLSGGELHRVAIAQALVCRPALVIADEPTRSLDVTLQVEIRNALRDINRTYGSTLIFITHNPALLTGFADRVMVMYAGRIVEAGPVAQVYRRPLHPYTKGLLQLIPEPVQPSGPISSFTRRERLPAIPGSLTPFDQLGRGCAFEPRCSARTADCQIESPEEIAPEPDRRVSCFNHGN
jgi:peptide/nickel transport system ATP-binding protein